MAKVKDFIDETTEDLENVVDDPTMYDDYEKVSLGQKIKAGCSEHIGAVIAIGGALILGIGIAAAHFLLGAEDSDNSDDPEAIEDFTSKVEVDEA